MSLETTFFWYPVMYHLSDSGTWGPLFQKSSPLMNEFASNLVAMIYGVLATKIYHFKLICRKTWLTLLKIEHNLLHFFSHCWLSTSLECVLRVNWAPCVEWQYRRFSTDGHFQNGRHSWPIFNIFRIYLLKIFLLGLASNLVAMIYVEVTTKYLISNWSVKHVRHCWK